MRDQRNDSRIPADIDCTLFPVNATVEIVGKIINISDLGVAVQLDSANHNMLPLKVGDHIKIQFYDIHHGEEMVFLERLTVKHIEENENGCVFGGEILPGDSLRYLRYVALLKMVKLKGYRNSVNKQTGS